MAGASQRFLLHVVSDTLYETACQLSQTKQGLRGDTIALLIN